MNATGGRITPRRLGVVAAVYGVFAAGWYLGQPVAPACHVGQASYGTDFSASPSVPQPPVPVPDPFTGGSGSYRALVVVSDSARACGGDTDERPRLEAWFEGDWQ
ncbi:hypothetical protein [Streptomyces sp. NPDC047130]|uniref:hypothetical protein n=1 Tax=Streptomyces sp. NPDC047130 TaxID=3155261 RepID=UPI0033D71B93